ncbi:GtrA family protein [Salipiger bermudensis]|uniref:GtrA family protein n=1 Tax=Salipiger bermudensis TaxID=344736 RepID=UPI000C900EE0|nr:GtrA family protein [Salipiger bermudensis]MAE90913.1 polysaccharide biosynthesis protein GtrA [Pelagibaca sp.]MBN9678024.1 GtrA family protein [Salipiger bermudensis]
MIEAGRAAHIGAIRNREVPVSERSRQTAAGERRRHLGGFALAGLAGFGVDAGVLSALLGLGLSPGLARVPSFVAAVLTTWAINRTLTFRTSTRASLAEFLRYILAMGLGLAINYATFLLALRLSEAAAAQPVLALVPATAAGMVVNFLSSRHILHR